MAHENTVRAPVTARLRLPTNLAAELYNQQSVRRPTAITVGAGNKYITLLRLGRGGGTVRSSWPPPMEFAVVWAAALNAKDAPYGRSRRSSNAPRMPQPSGSRSGPNTSGGPVPKFKGPARLRAANTRRRANVAANGTHAPAGSPRIATKTIKGDWGPQEKKRHHQRKNADDPNLSG